MNTLTEESDNFGGRGRARRSAKRAAKKVAKSKGLKGKAKRQFARDAKQEVKAKQLIKKASTKHGKKATRIVTRAKKIQALDGRTRVGQSALTVAIAPLLPFKSAMSKALRGKGINTTYMSFPMLVNSFYNNVVSKRNNHASQYDAISPNFLEDHLANNYTADEVNNLEDSNNLVTPIAAIVTAIINFFKKVIKKKKEKKPLKKVEKQIANDGEKAVKKLKQKKADQKPITRGDVKKKSKGHFFKKLFKGSPKSQLTIETKPKPKKEHDGSFISGLADLGSDIGQAVMGQDSPPQEVQIDQNGQPVQAGFGGGGNNIKYIVIGILGLVIAYAMFKK